MKALLIIGMLISISIANAKEKKCDLTVAGTKRVWVKEVQYHTYPWSDTKDYTNSCQTAIGLLAQTITQPLVCSTPFLVAHGIAAINIYAVHSLTHEDVRKLKCEKLSICIAQESDNKTLDSYAVVSRTLGCQ